jgi:PAS domain S-box-containing protein
MKVLRGPEGQDRNKSGVLRILLLEDSPVDAELIETQLSEGGVVCELSRVQTRDAFAAALEEGGADLILADYRLQGFDGLSALRLARKIRPKVPFILVSGTLGEEVAIETLKRGATDYVLKHRLERLLPAIRRAIREAEERSERERAEEALRRSEEEYRAMFELAGVGKAQADLAMGRFLRVNRELCRITGYSEDELLGMTFAELVHPEDREGNLARFRRLTRGETAEYAVEERFVSKDREIIWVSVNVALIRNASGQPWGTVATIQDITKRKRTEEEFARLASFPSLSSTPIVETAVASEPTFISPAARERFPDLVKLGQSHPILADLVSVGQNIRKSGEQPVSSEVWVDDVLYQRLIFAVPGSDLLRLYATDITEYRQAERALRRSEERFRSLVRYASDIIVILDAEGIVLYESPAVERVLGFRPDERFGTDAFAHIHPDDLETVRSKFAELRDGPDLRLSVEYRMRDSSGVWRHFEAIATNLLDDPVIRGIVVNTRDISERRQAEEALRESEERFRWIFEQAAVGVAQVGPDGRWLRVNDKLCEITGYTRSELLEKTFQDITFREDLDTDLENMRRLLDGDIETYSREKRYARKDGSIVWVNLTVSLVRDQADIPKYFISVIGDISKRKRAEKALKDSEELHRTVVEQAAENIFVVDLESKRILEANAALQRSLDYTLEELKGMTLYDVVAHDQESIDNITEHIIAEHHYLVGERKYRRKDGSLIDVEVNAGVILYGDSRAMCIVAHDVTESKRAQAALRQSLSVLLALREAGQVLSSTLESEEIATRLLEIMRSVAGLTAAVISRNDQEGNLRIWRSAGVEDLWPRVRFTPEAKRARRAALENEERQHFKLRRPGSEDEYLVGLCLPLGARNRIVGVLEAYGQESLAQGDMTEIISSLTSQAASALENAWLYEELGNRERALQDLVEKLLGAQEEERRRVAYEVHDGLAQVAVAAHQNLQAFARRHTPEAEKGRRELDRILGQVRATVSDARRVIANLRPTALDDLGLGAAISLEIEHLSEEGYHVDYKEHLGEERLPGEMEITLFRVTQEALTNVRKHAGTQWVSIELRRRDGEVYLEVRDSGRGFDPAVLETLGGGPGERVGFAGMRERVSMLGGELKIQSRPNAGTSIAATIPLTRTT